MRDAEPSRVSVWSLMRPPRNGTEGLRGCLEEIQNEDAQPQRGIEDKHEEIDEIIAKKAEFFDRG